MTEMDEGKAIKGCEKKLFCPQTRYRKSCPLLNVKYFALTTEIALLTLRC